MKSIDLAKEIEDEIIRDRRELHKIPELQLELPQTVNYITNELNKNDIEYKLLVDGNAIVAEIGKNDGKCIAIRADMDALPIEEETGDEFASTHKGCMHACGHDSHAAMALGAAKILKKIENELNGKVKIFFQPGEEIPGGAKPMIDEGAMENPKVDAVIGMHAGTLFDGVNKGSFGYKKGPMMAAMDRFKIIITGKGGHGARPHQVIDPIIIISEINLGLQKIISREIDPNIPALISVCQIHGGTTQNIIPNTVWEEGTVRNLNEDTRDFIERRMGEIAEYIAKAYGAKAELIYERFYPTVINDSDFTEFVKNTAIDMFGEGSMIELKNPTMGGEDVSFFLNEAPGTFLALENPRVYPDGKIYPHHNSKFDIDESLMYRGTALFVEVVRRFLKGE